MTIPIPVEAASGGAPILRWWRARLAALARAAMERDARYRAAHHLARMENHMLRDIGLTPDDVRGRRP